MVSLPALPQLVAITLVALGSIMACSVPSAPARDGKVAPGAPSDVSDPDESAGGVDVVPPAATSRGKLGLVVIDTQQVFFTTAGARNPASDIPSRMKNTQHVLELAGANHVPTFITYEASKTGDHGLPPTLAGAVPPQAQHLIKTTFAATGQPQFLGALKASELRRLLVVGAETDVCVLQTMLGLRRAGFEVLALVDALFTEEVNDGPALRRMRQAGVIQVKMKDAEALLTEGAASVAPATASPPSIVRPLEVGIVLHDLASLTAADANSAGKRARLKELLLISEWFRMPVLAADTAQALAALPADLRALLKHPILALAERPAAVKQVVVAGGRSGLDGAVAALAKAGDVFLLEDVLLGGADLEPLYVKGAVPSTYKTLYYEMIQSVSDAEWPSQQWVTDSNPYFDLTQSPESLPPIHP